MALVSLIRVSSAFRSRVGGPAGFAAAGAGPCLRTASRALAACAVVFAGVSTGAEAGLAAARLLGTGAAAGATGSVAIVCFVAAPDEDGSGAGAAEAAGGSGATGETCVAASGCSQACAGARAAHAAARRR
ncbi:MAG: hypothetical protein HY661_05640 [Betaproteobacteria bacterium]|nr:hypothetical protein [Betaproteobacteria bacterium]